MVITNHEISFNFINVNQITKTIITHQNKIERKEKNYKRIEE